MGFYDVEENFIGHAMLPCLYKGEAGCIHIFQDEVYLASRKAFTRLWDLTNKPITVVIGGVEYRIAPETSILERVCFSRHDIGMPVTLSTEDGLITIPHPKQYSNEPAWSCDSIIIIGKSRYKAIQEEHDPIGVMTYLKWVGFVDE